MGVMGQHAVKSLPRHGKLSKKDGKQHHDGAVIDDESAGGQRRYEKLQQNRDGQTDGAEYHVRTVFAPPPGVGVVHYFTDQWIIHCIPDGH